MKHVLPPSRNPYPRRRPSPLGLFVFLALLIPAVACAAGVDTTRLSTIRLPEGFAIELFAEVPNARSMTLGEKTLFVGNRQGDAVYAVELIQGEHGYTAGKRYTIADDLWMPNGVAMRDGDLYVAQVDEIWRYPEIEAHLADPPKPVLVTDRLPSERHHGWKFIAFGPDGLLYVPVGAPCNICDEGDPFATILRMRPDGSGQEVFARGIRNTVGFDWDSATGELWFTENGRDWMGDNQPPDELDHAPKPGMHFGFPYCDGTTPDPEFGGPAHPCSEFTPPAAEFQAHVAALGMRFYDGAMFPEEYRGDIFVAQHGSWNRSTPVGYRVMRVRMAGGAPQPEVFAEGWLQGEDAWGRPVDVQELPDGSLLVSDDEAGAVYRITYQGT